VAKNDLALNRGFSESHYLMTLFEFEKDRPLFMVTKLWEFNTKIAIARLI